MTPPLRPGLLVLHGNRLETLAQTVFAWLSANPLGALEEESFIVQSNGMAEWLKMEMAAAHGVCAATRIELPARFLWRAWRAVLGRDAVPALSPLDKQPLTWRLMSLLPRLAQEPDFGPVTGFLATGAEIDAAGRGGSPAADPAATRPAAASAPQGDPARRLQLAQRLADLFDQYQVYRSDWLADWSAGHDVVRPSVGAAAGATSPVPPEQRWQPALWRAALATLPDADLQTSRPQLHQRFLQALDDARRGAAAPSSDDPHGSRPTPNRMSKAAAAAAATATAARAWPALPRRVVLFGTTHLPQQTLETIAALSSHVQVLMAVPNPCRYHWADTIDGRELLHAARRRQPLRGGRDLAVVPLADLHAHGHPLLAAWGRQARDFVRQLDAFDDVQQASSRFDLPRLELPRVDLFDDGPGTTLLARLQARIRDLVPMSEQMPPTPPAADDRSVVFHVAHGAQREVEILHDQLLHLLAHPPPAAGTDADADADAEPGRALDPRDIVVMVPDIDTHAPAIRSVFGAFDRHAPRHIPWGIADQRDRGHHPLLVALEWLLQAPRPRCTFHELRDLLDVPAVARRFGIDPAELPTLVAWAAGAGVRWGLHAAHRALLDLPACGEANTWRFGLRRMLMGYATGKLPAAAEPLRPDADDEWQVEPYAEVAGLSAHLAGALARLLDELDAWWADAVVPLAPAQWGPRLRTLVKAVFMASDDTERALLSALDDALAGWLQSCEAGGFDEAVALDVVREAWLDAVDEPGRIGGSRRFKAGGVTFCTLLPLRAIPFPVVCLLGMNEGDYPRRSPRSDFDLMALPGQARPGDRSRRDDDRQLMLDALLSARRVLYVSWAGRSVRDNEAQPPSVLVSQLRDHIAAAFGPGVVEARTTEHPLQPFSRRYFEAALPHGADGHAGERPDEFGDKRDGMRDGERDGKRDGELDGRRDGKRNVARDHDRVGGHGGDAQATVDATPVNVRGPGLFTYATEWRSAHTDAARAVSLPEKAPQAMSMSALRPDAGPRSTGPVTVQALAGFLRNPVKAFFGQRLQVRFDEREAEGDDDEAFVSAGLDRWQLLDEVLRGARARHADSGAVTASTALQAQVEGEVARLQRAGRLPMAGPGRRVAVDLVRTLLPMVAQWQTLMSSHLQAHARLPLRLALPSADDPHVDLHADPLDGGLDDGLTGLRSGGEAGATPVWIELQASPLADRKPKSRPGKNVDDKLRPRADKLLTAWVRCLAASACGRPAGGILIGADAVVQVSAPVPDAARQTLQALLAACAEGTRGTQPLPTAVRTGMAWLGSPTAARSVYEGSDRGGPGESREASLARLYPDFAALLADPGFENATRRLYEPFAAWLDEHVTVRDLPDHADLGDEGIEEA